MLSSHVDRVSESLNCGPAVRHHITTLTKTEAQSKPSAALNVFRPVCHMAKYTEITVGLEESILFKGIDPEVGIYHKKTRAPSRGVERLKYIFAIRNAGFERFIISPGFFYAVVKEPTFQRYAALSTALKPEFRIAWKLVKSLGNKMAHCGPFVQCPVLRKYQRAARTRPIGIKALATLAMAAITLTKP